MAVIEIVPWDASLVLIISKIDKIVEDVITNVPFAEDLETHNYLNILEGNMNNRGIIEQMKAKDIMFSEGLTTAEINRIEDIYDIRFPKSLRIFYSICVPFSERNKSYFPQWADFSNANIAKIKEHIQEPIIHLLLAVKHEFWLSKWGKRPDSSDEAVKYVSEIVIGAPKLIPVFSHRYMPQLESITDPPVISAVGRDIVIYGCNLKEYLRNEFLSDHHPTVSGNGVYIPFWSDIIERCKWFQDI
jgi:hypothetical protein